MRRPAQKIIFAVSGVALLYVCVLLYPISSFFTRALSVSLVLCLWALLAFLSWRHRFLRVPVAAVTLTILTLFVSPGRNFETSILAESYESELLAYGGTTYLWGGENTLGIDCSGLVRRALVNAAFARGIVTLNPSLIRFGFSLWWHDRSASQIGEGYRDESFIIGDASSVNAIVETDLRLGDLAVTSSGVHVLAYIGNRTWVEADPNIGRVVEIRVPDAENPWFNTPVKIVRWRILDGPAV